MKLYPLFVLMATATVFSPGPGVVMTLTNALRYGMRGTIGGILGVSFGALIVAAISATSVGVILAASSLAFTTLKYLGAAYLIFLGIKLWRAPAFEFHEQDSAPVSFQRRFFEGVSLQLTNPKAIFFFLSVFPQFIDPHLNYGMQFAVLVATYSILIVIIHSSYALFAGRARHWLSSGRGGKVVNQVGAVTFVFFGVAMATVKR